MAWIWGKRNTYVAISMKVSKTKQNKPKAVVELWDDPDLSLLGIWPKEIKSSYKRDFCIYSCLIWYFLSFLFFSPTRHHNYSLPSLLSPSLPFPLPLPHICFPLFPFRKKKASMEYQLDKAYQIKGAIEGSCSW